MGEPLRVAVTGVGGGCGQGIMKALFASRMNVDVFPVDITPLSAGLYRGRCGGTVLPKPEDDIEAWEAWLVENRINAVLPGSDHDLLPLAKVRDDWWGKHKINVLVSSVELVNIANDKRLTCAALCGHGLDAPLIYVNGDLQRLSYPVVVKPAFGMTSRGVQVCHNEDELMFYYERTTNPVIQEYLPGDEYTCAVFMTKYDGPLYFIGKRDLYAGTTYRMQVIPHEDVPEITEYLKKIAYALQPRGALNVQLKLVPDRGPVAFELNVRCSGSTAMRAMAGYNEPGLMLRHYVLHEKVFQPKAIPGYFFRFWEEMFLPGVTETDLHSVTNTAGTKGRIESWL